MGLIPKEKIKRKTDNPKNLIMFGLPKVGKTTLLSMLPKCLIIDYLLVAWYGNISMKPFELLGNPIINLRTISS